MPEITTDMLLFGVIGTIAVNRVFQASSAKRRRPAYVGIQGVDLALVIVLFILRIPGYGANVDIGIRTFLMCFVAWHMVRNSQARTRALREDREAARSAEERRERMAAFAADQAGVGEAVEEPRDEPER